MGKRRKADFELPSAEGQAGYPADMTPMGDQVERFSHTPERMLATGNGDWVRYSDYVKLNERLNEATDARVYYREKLKRAEAERDQAREQVEKLERALEEAEDRFESCDICERPSRKEDLKAVWVKDAESGEQADAQVCLICRLESDRRSEREQVLKEVEERLLADANVRGMAEEAFGPYAGPLSHQRLREVVQVVVASLHTDQSKGER